MLFQLSLTTADIDENSNLARSVATFIWAISVNTFYNWYCVFFSSGYIPPDVLNFQAYL